MPRAGALLSTLPGHRDWVLAVAWSPTATRIATGSRDRTAKVFDVATGPCWPATPGTTRRSAA